MPIEGTFVVLTLKISALNLSTVRDPEELSLFAER